jgi:hypothetical protein
MAMSTVRSNMRNRGARSLLVQRFMIHKLVGRLRGLKLDVWEVQNGNPEPGRGEMKKPKDRSLHLLLLDATLPQQRLGRGPQIITG